MTLVIGHVPVPLGEGIIGRWEMAGISLLKYNWSQVSTTPPGGVKSLMQVFRKKLIHAKRHRFITMTLNPTLAFRLAF